MKIISNNSGTNRSLILAGGGARLSYQAGVLMALEEAGLTFNHVDGTSGGIFNTAMLASGIEPFEMATRWRSIKVMNFSSLLRFKNYFSRKTFAAFGDADGIVNKIFPALGIDVAKMNNNTTIDATFNVCNFSKKTVEVFTNKNVALQHLIAGMSLPVFMPAVKINGDWYTDAVWIKDANISEAIKRNPKEIWLVWAIGNSHEFLNGAFNQYVHMIEISANGGLLLEFEQLEKLNQEKSDKEKIVLHVIKPEFPLPLDPDLMLNRINVDELINRGYADAKEYLKGRLSDGVIPDFNATLMKEPGSVLVLRALFNGKLQWKHSTICSININFNFRLVNDNFILRAYASIAFDNDNRISTFNNITTIEPNKGFVIFDSDFIYCQKVHHLQCKMKASSQFDLILGMELKKAHCTITTNDLSAPITFLMKQRAADRIKNAFFMHINSNEGWYEKWKTKFRILSMIYDK